MGAGVAHAVNDVAAARVRNGDRCHRRTTRGEFVDGGGIQIGIGRHRQGARNRRGGHDQLMRVEALLQTFLPQRQTLMNTKAVLFVDNHQRQAVKLHLFLENGVRADNHLHLPAGYRLLLRKARFALLLPGQPAHFNSQRGKPVTEIVGVLLGQQFRRCHQRHLLAVGDSAQSGQRGDQRFTGTHIALHQAHHRHIQRHIAFDLGGHPRLGAGGFKRQ